MATGRRLPGYFPQMERRAWEDVAPELSKFLRRMFDSQNDGIPAGFNNITPEQVNADGVDDPGLESDGWASASHDHDIETGPAVALANSNTEGVAQALARADHTHKRDVRFKLNDADVATRNAPNFIDGDLVWTLNDDLPNDEVEISGKLSTLSRTFAKGGTKPGATFASDAIVWEAPFPATVIAVRGVWVNGIGAPVVTVNARRNFTSEHLASDLSLPSSGVVYDGGAVQNTAYVAGDILEARIKSLTGGTADVTVIIRLRRD
jgi:hypothetical protein